MVRYECADSLDCSPLQHPPEMDLAAPPVGGAAAFMGDDVGLPAADELAVERHLVGAIGVQERVQLLVIGRFRVAFGWSKNKVNRRATATPMSAESFHSHSHWCARCACPFARTSCALRLLLAEEEELLGVCDFAHELLSELVDVGDAREARVVHAQADQRQFGTLGVLEARVACTKSKRQTTIATAKRMSELQSQPIPLSVDCQFLLLLRPCVVTNA